MAQRRLKEIKDTYNWGTNDCLTMVTGTLRLIGAVKAADKWSGMVNDIRQASEARTAVSAKNKYGSVSLAIGYGLDECGLVELKTDSLLPYDIVLLEDHSLTWDCSIGFVDEDSNIRVWSWQERSFVILARPVVRATYRVPMEELT